MRIEETSALLAKIQAFDNRNVDEAVLSAWSEVVEPYTLADCLAAVTDYFRTSTAWIMPAHIVERVMLTQRARLDGFGAQPRLSDHDEQTCGDYSAANKALYGAIRNGRMDRAAYERYQASTVGILEALGTPKALK
jgi:hypothetical protein